MIDPRLRDLVEQIDRLHDDAWLDIRHRDRFLQSLEHHWPHIARLIRDAMGPLPAMLVLVA